MNKISQSILKSRVWLVGLVFFAVLLFAAFPSLYAAALNNLAIVRLLKTSACDPQWFVCQVLPDPYPLIAYKQNQADLESVKHLFRQALALNPERDLTRLHLAEIAFALGDRKTSANHFDETEDSSLVSPLLQDSRYEARLVQARQQAAEGNWEAAVNNFRLGLSWGDERTLPVDEKEYFLALAELEKLRMSQEGVSSPAIYRLGRYLAAAGEWEEAVGWLGRSQLLGDLPPTQTAWALLTIGRFQEAAGDWRNAILTYKKAIERDQTLRQAYIRLIPLLHLEATETEIETYRDKLLSLGPSYYLGAQGENYQAFEPVELPDGWTLVGYDLDEEMLEQAKRLELILWWKGNDKQPKGDGWIQVGDFWLQRQMVINLFPNAGFEWGVDERGIPLGHDREFYGAPTGSLTITNKTKKEVNSEVAVANNSDEVRHVALASRNIPVESSGNYLMAGQIWDQVGFATIGRDCFGETQVTSALHYITKYVPDRPLSVWNEYAELSSPIPGELSRLCTTLLMNDANSNMPAFWDNVLFVRLTDYE